MELNIAVWDNEKSLHKQHYNLKIKTEGEVFLRWSLSYSSDKEEEENDKSGHVFK